MFEDINDSALVEDWSKIENVPYQRYGIRLDKSEFPITRKDGNIFKLFTYLKLLPTPRCSFAKAVNSFVIHTEVSIMLCVLNKPTYLINFRSKQRTQMWTH